MYMYNMYIDDNVIIVAKTAFVQNQVRDRKLICVLDFLSSNSEIEVRPNMEI